MKRVLSTCIVSFIFLLSFCQDTSKVYVKPKGTGQQSYNKGVEVLKLGSHAWADSLFTLAINDGYTITDCYFNRAIARKKLGNNCGYCVDIACAAERGDKEANSLFWKKCPLLDSVLSCTKNIRITIEDTVATISQFDSLSQTERISLLHITKGILSRQVINTTGGVDTSGRIYEMVSISEPAQFPGGGDAMFKFLAKNIKFPYSDGLSGKVLVSFIVERDGTISTVELYRAIQGGEKLNNEAMRVVKLMPKWNPGKHDGVTVRMRFILPIHFKLG